MTAKNKDTALFHNIVQGVRRITNDKVQLAPKKRLKKTLVIEAPKNAHSHIPDVSRDEKLFFKSMKVPPKILSQLKQGKLIPEDSIDLHGMILAEATQYLETFLTEMMAKEVWCVCIIHGKGRQAANPLLKNYVNRLLRNDPRILAFASAPQKRGGNGAVIVLLK